MYIYGTDSTIYGRLTMKTDLHQQHDKMACVDDQTVVCKPINQVSEDTVDSPMSKYDSLKVKNAHER